MFWCSRLIVGAHADFHSPLNWHHTFRRGR
nr:MAG TPA: hypothetical protein [Caudoviricetes sp.]